MSELPKPEQLKEMKGPKRKALNDFYASKDFQDLNRKDRHKMKVLRLAQFKQLDEKSKIVQLAQELEQMALEKEHGLETRQEEKARVKD